LTNSKAYANINTMTHENTIDQPKPIVDELIILGGHMPGRGDAEAVERYIDQSEEADVDINFKSLMASIYNQRLSNQEETGILFDPIDDAAFMASPEDLVGFMRPDQIMSHFDDLIATDSRHVADRIVAKMSPEFIHSDLHEDQPVRQDPELAKSSVISK
jgi:hypothetical protein